MHCSRVDAFRHRADPILVDRAVRSHLLPRLTLTGTGAIKDGGCGFASDRANYWEENACRATNVIRHGLCPILNGAREALSPLAASLAIISSSL